MPGRSFVDHTGLSTGELLDESAQIEKSGERLASMRSNQGIAKEFRFLCRDVRGNLDLLYRRTTPELGRLSLSISLSASRATCPQSACRPALRPQAVESKPQVFGSSGFLERR